MIEHYRVRPRYRNEAVTRRPVTPTISTMNPVLQLFLGTIAIGVGGFAFALLVKDGFDTCIEILRDLFGRRGR